MAQPHHLPRVTHYHVRIYDCRAVLWIGATNKTDHGRNAGVIDIETSILMIERNPKISSSPLPFSFRRCQYSNNFSFLSKQSSLTCCRGSCPASRRDCKEHESLGSPRTPRRSISGDGPSKSVSPSNSSSVSDSSRPANEKSPTFIRRESRSEKNISGWWKSDRVYARQICQSYYTEVCRSLPAICLRYSRLDPWQGTSPKVSCWDRIFDPRCTLVESMKGDIHTHTRAYTHTYASRNEYKSIFPGLNGRVSVECRYFCPSGN